MQRICNGCLRYDRKLQAVDNTLSNLFDELCKFGVLTDALARFCTECTYMLIKINQFRTQCRLASETLKNWKKKNKNEREQLDDLSTIMPPSRLNLANTKNLKVYYCQAFQLNSLTASETSKHPHIITLSVPITETSTETLKTELGLYPSKQLNENEILIPEPPITVKQEIHEIIDASETVIMRAIQVENITSANMDDVLIDKVYKNTKIYENVNNINFDNDLPLNDEHNIDESIKNDDSDDDDDINLKKLAQKKNAKKYLSKIEVDEARDVNSSEEELLTVPKFAKSKITMRELRSGLLRRFDSCGELKDGDGNIIDTDVIINNLKIIPLPVLRQLKSQVAVGYSPPVLAPESVKLLVQLHEKYSIKNPETNLISAETDAPFCEKDYNDFEHTDDSTNISDDNQLDTFNFTECDVSIVKSDNDYNEDEVIPKKIEKRTTRQRKNTKIVDEENGTEKRITNRKATVLNADNEAKDTIQMATKKERRQKISKEELKRRLIKAFSNCGEMKDEEGNPIDADLILNSLDDMALRSLRRLKNQLAIKCGKRILTPEGIAFLSQLQKKFSNEYSSGFTVEHLPTKERMLEEFAKRQYYEKYIIADHKCKLCFTTYRCEMDLANHIKSSHNEKNRFVCQVCNVRLGKLSSLHWHLYRHRSVYRCNLCPFVGYQKVTMITHYNQHRGVIYTCDYCSATFKSRSGHYMHMNKFHETKHTCKVCGKSFFSEHGLKFHHSKKHQGQDTSKPGVCHKAIIAKKKYYKKYITCPVCKKREEGVNAMKRHFKDDHPSESFDGFCITNNKHLCHVCGKAYQSATALNDHKNLHTGVRPYSCDVCGATFAKKGSLKTHVETHMPPTKECKICGKKFKGATNLMNHMLYHKPPSKECTMCGKMFSTGSNLYNHMKRHLGDRRYKCEICSKSFLDTSSRNEHVRGVHNNIRRVRNKRT